MNQYSYEGPVKEFDRIVSSKWKATTYAQSEAKARSNLAFQYKKMYKKSASSKITLPGKIVLIA
jgi:hypothetical protein